MRSALFCAALAAVLTPAGVGAQSLTLTEADALARLSADSPRARAARAGVDVVRADVLGAGRWPNPRLTLNRESVAGVAEHMVMVAQPLPVTGRRGLEVQAATALVDASSKRADDEIRRLQADLRLAFADLVSAQTRERELTAARDRLRELAGVLEKRENAGDAAGFDRLRAEREVVELDADRGIAAAARARAQALVASFFADAMDPAAVVAVPRATASLSVVPSIDALVEQAESTRGELLAFKREVEAAEFSRRAAERRGLPEPEVVAGTKSSNVGTGDIGSVFSVHAVIPLFDRGRPERAFAVARGAEAAARAEALRAVLRGQIAALRAVVLERRDAAERYRTQALGGVGEIERIAQVSYEAGERGILELLDAFRTGAAARLRQVEFDAAVRQAEIELAFVSGWEVQ
jgi:cobalt-zinc-cadmium efflux system outer membrane protein